MVDPKLNTLTWLHLSDLHLSSANTSDPILTAILDRIKQEVTNEDGLHPDLLFCSGDIAYSGKTNDYEPAKEFFNKLLEITRVDKQKLCIVPGNHDVDLDVDDKQIRALQHALIEDESESKQCFEDSATRESLVARFPGFQSFCSLFLERPFDQFDNNCFAVIILVKGFKIGFIGFNSAWFSKGGKEDDRHLFLGVPSLQKVFEKLERQGKPDLTIVMLHHPIDWLVEGERYAIMDLLLEKADVVLTGHTHRGSAYAKYTSPKGRKVLFLEVGATGQADKRPNRAFFVRVDVGSRKFEVYPITFENGQWVNDTRLFPDMKDGYAIFDLMMVQRRATLRVENKELEKVPNQIPFMENQAAGKFVKEKAWSIVKNELDFSKLQPLDLTGPSRIYLIKGKPGMGKSTYLLWSLDESLRNESWPFDQIVFLHPEYYDLWAEELHDCDPERTLLVIDALRRGTDTDSRFVDRCLELQILAFEGKRVHERLIGPFKILATIRDDEYHDLMKQKAFEWMSPEVFDITPEKLVPERILKKLLTSHKVSYEIPADREKGVMEKLATKSEGSPFYIRHLVKELSRRSMSFSEEALEEYPAGMVNLIWHVLTKRYYIKDDDFIPFLLLLLLKTDRPFSDHFLNFVVERLVQKQKKEVEEKVASLKSSYLQDFPHEVGQRQIKDFALSSHWKQSLETGLKQPDAVTSPYRDTVLSYKKIEDLHFTRLIDETIKELEIQLGEGFKETADAFLCVDLAKIGNDCLEHATRLYTDFHFSSKLKRDHIEYIRGGLFELWISKAWEYRALHDDDQVVACYENAFDRLGVRSDYEQLHAYAYYLRKRILPGLKYGTLEFQRCREKIEGIFKEVIANQLEQGAKLLSYQSLASFYAELGEDEKAEDAFKGILEIDPTYIPARQAYAIFLKNRGRREWVKDHKKALEYYRTSEEQFKKLLVILEDIRAKLPQKELEEQETKLLNAYAIFLSDKTEWERSYDDRLRIDTQVDELFEKILREYPHHGRSVCAYSLFLMKYAKILPKYKGGENLKKAEKLLKGFIEFEKVRKERSLSYFVALEIQASYLSRIASSFYNQTPNWEEIERTLKESSESFDPHHNSIAYHSLGRLYVQWANVLRKKENMNGYNEKMNLAKEAYEKAMEIIPENQLSATHLSRVYISYAFYLKYRGETPKSVEYMNKALELAQKFTYVPFASYFALCNLGKEMFQDQDTELARVTLTEARKIGEKLGINPSYAIYMLGEICRQEQKIDEALEHYVLSARLENTSEGWGTRRDSIRQLMDDWGIRKSKSPTIYGNCIKKRLECSKEAWQLDQTFWKNCGDYGEDLLVVGEFEEAIRILEIGVSLVQQSNELNEVDKRKKLSWFYEKIGFCYKDQGNSMRAEEHLLRAAETEDSAVGYFRATGWMFELHSFEKTLMVFRKFVEKISSCEEKEKFLPNIANALKKIAVSYENLSKEHEAALVWKDYAAISFYSSPQDGASECGKAGNKLIKLNRFLEARECFLRSNRLNPNHAKNLSQLGYVNMMLQRWEECAICSQKAFETRGDIGDRELSDFCQRQHKKDIRVSDSNSVENTLDKAILSEILGKCGDALEYYSHTLRILEKQSCKDKTKLSIRRFVADAVWILGRKDEALKLYEEIGDEVADYEKMIVETITWFIRNALDRQTDLDVKERILSLLKVGPLKGDSEKALSVEIGKRFGIDPLIIEKLFGSLYAEKLIRKSNFAEYSPITNSTRVSVVLSLAKHGQEVKTKTTKMNPS
jgi:tetratricopeptide (TPR) repeat protein/3',5'-cyclic AMP phosphodiesterase CpdA